MSSNFYLMRKIHLSVSAKEVKNMKIAKVKIFVFIRTIINITKSCKVSAELITAENKEISFTNS